MTDNLSKYYRVPKININFPCDKKYYPENFIEYSLDGSIPVRAMTSADELMLKNPDALLNGDAIINVIKSCLPAVVNPKKLLVPDIESALLGIFYASYGTNLSFSSDCPECKHHNDFDLPIRDLLDRQSYLDYPATVTLEIGKVVDDINTKIVVYVKPYDFETNMRHQLVMFEQSKLMQYLEKAEGESEEEKLKQFSECFNKIVRLRFENAAGSILKFELKKEVNAEWEITTIEKR